MLHCLGFQGPLDGGPDWSFLIISLGGTVAQSCRRFGATWLLCSTFSITTIQVSAAIPHRPQSHEIQSMGASRPLLPYEVTSILARSQQSHLRGHLHKRKISDLCMVCIGASTTEHYSFEGEDPKEVPLAQRCHARTGCRTMYGRARIPTRLRNTCLPVLQDRVVAYNV